MQGKEPAVKKPAPGDDSINFRPSPNFKHMKKYLKSKFEEMSSASKAPEPQPEEVKDVKDVKDVVKDVKDVKEVKEVKPKPAPVEEKVPVLKKEKAKPPPPPPPPPTIQPPLPPNPPPPDSPPPAIKQEIIDEEYNHYLNTAAAMSIEEMMPQYTTEMPQAPPKDSAAAVTMCRNFVRGTCTKGASCIFVHELILDQLPGVYTFCRNFQNRQCTFARCKFVHATVFEKEYFYRTGYLPPHALAHLKAAPPPPPPPEDPVAPAQPVQQTVQLQNMAQSYYPLNMDMSSQGMSNMSVGDMSCAALPTYMLQNPVPTVNEQHNIYGPSTSAQPSLTSPLKRHWDTAMGMDEAAYGQTEMPTEEPLVKKCRDCDSIEFRYQFNKNKIENMISSSDELTKKLNQLNAKSQRLCVVLVTLFKPQASGIGGLTSPLSERDKAILDQLNVLLPPNNRPMMGEDELTKNLPYNIQNIMAQLLMNTDQSMMQ